MADLLGSILRSMERPPQIGDKESRRKAREQAARLKKMQEHEKRQKLEFRKRMEKEVSEFIQDSKQNKKKYRPMGKIERSILHDVAEVAGLTSFSFGDDDESRYVMIFKKEFPPSDDELDAYRKGEEWSPEKAEEKKKLKERALREAEEDALRAPRCVLPATDYKDKYSHLIGKIAAKEAAHTLQANKSYGCVPVANKRDTRSIEEAMNEIHAKKRLKLEEQAARLKKMQEHEKRQKLEFRKRMEKEVSEFIQDSKQNKKKYRPMGKIERSILHDVAEVAGLTSFSFGDDDESRYVMIFKKEFPPSDDELDAYRKGEEWSPEKAEEKKKLKERALREAEEDALRAPRCVLPATDYKDKYSHLIGKIAAKEAAHTLQANKSYGCVPVANKRDTRSIEEAMNEIRAKKRLKLEDGDTPRMHSEAPRSHQ